MEAHKNKTSGAMFWLSSTIIASFIVADFSYQYFQQNRQTLEFAQYYPSYRLLYILIFLSISLSFALSSMLIFRHISKNSYREVLKSEALSLLPVALILPYVIDFPFMYKYFHASLFWLALIAIVVIKIITWTKEGKNNLLAAAILGVFVLLTLTTRLYFLLGAYANLCSDEALVGLMARHIIFDNEFPVFLYGQARQGSIEAFLAVPMFLLFGATPVVIKLVPLFFSLILNAFIFIFTDFVFSRRVAYIALLFFALPGSFLAVYSVLTIAYIETLTFGMAIVLVSFIAIDMKNYTPARVWVLAGLGLLVGLGLWNNFIIMPWVGAILILVLFELAKRLKLIEYLVGIIGMTLGLLPAIVYNVLHPGISIHEHMHYNRFSSISEFTANLKPVILFVLQKIIPNAFGLDFAALIHPALGLAVLIAMYLSILYAFFAAFLCKSSMYSRERTAIIFLLLVLAICFLSYLTTRASLDFTIRHAIVFIPPIVLLVAWVINRISNRSRIAGVLIITIILVLNIGSMAIEQYNPNMHPHGMPFATADAMLDFLKDHDISRVYAGYWQAYELDFYCREKVIFAPRPGFDRYPKYMQIVDSTDPKDIAYLYEQGSLPEKEFLEKAELDNLKLSAKSIEKFVIYYNLKSNVFL